METLQAFDLAAKQIGLTETGQQAALQDYMATGGVNLDPATTAWCAAFVNASLAQAGQSGTGSNMARSFLEWGQPVDQPQRGDIAVFSRGDPNGEFGHVGFFDGYNENGTIRVLGGNQGANGAVSVSNYSPNSLLGFRRDGNQAPQNGLGGIGPAQPGQAPQNALGAVAAPPQSPQFKATQLDPRAFQMPQNQLSLIYNS